MGIEIKNGSMDYLFLSVPASFLAATQLKEKRCANIILLGVLNQALELFKEETIEGTIRKAIPKAAELNVEAYQLGRNLVISELKQSR